MSQYGAITAPELAILRNGPQSSETFLSVIPPRVIMQAQVSQLIFTYPLASLDIENAIFPNGDTIVDVLPNLDVWIGTTPDARDVFVGRTRLAGDGVTATAILLNINEISAGGTSQPQEVNLFITPGMYVTIVETYSAYYALPNFVDVAGTLQVRKDYDVPYTDQNELPLPVANISYLEGTSPVGFVDNVTTDYRVKLSGESSFEAITGASVTSYLWDIGDGVLVGGYALSDETIEVDFPQGSRWVSLLVTDSNAKTHTARNPLMYYDVDNQPQRVLSASDSRDLKGRSMTISGEANELTLEAVPHGALCYVWDRQEFGGQTSEYVISYFIGWAVREGVAIVSLGPDVSIEIVGPVPMLANVSAVPQRVENATSPANWQEAVSGMVNIPGMVYYLLFWHLPAYLTLFDLRLFPDDEDWSTTNQPGFGAQGDLGGTVLGQQIARLATRLPGNFGSTSTGALVLTRNHQYNNDRSGVVARMTIIANSDTEGVASDRSHRLSTGQVMGDGLIFTQGQVVPVRSIAQGRAPSASGGRAQIQGLIVGNQIDLNRVTGAHYAILNIPQSIDITLLHSLDVFEPCLGYRVGLQVTASDFDDPVYGEAWRRIFDIPFDRASLSPDAITKWCYVQSVAVSHANGSKGVRLRLVPEVTSTPGATLPIEQVSSQKGIGSFEFNDPSLPPLDFDISFDFTFGVPGVGTYDFPQIDFPPLGMSPPPPPPKQLSQYGPIPDEPDVFAVVSQGGQLHIVGTDLESLVLGAPTWRLFSTFGYDDGTYSFGDMILDPNAPTERAVILKQDSAGSLNYTVRVCDDITASTWSWDSRQTLLFNPPEFDPYCHPSPTRIALGVPHRLLAFVDEPNTFGYARFMYDQDVLPGNVEFIRTDNAFSTIVVFNTGWLGDNWLFFYGDEWFDSGEDPNEYLAKPRFINGIGYVIIGATGGSCINRYQSQYVYITGLFPNSDWKRSGNYGGTFSSYSYGGQATFSPHCPALTESGGDNDLGLPTYLLDNVIDNEVTSNITVLEKHTRVSGGYARILETSDIPELATWGSWTTAFRDAYSVTTSKTIGGLIATAINVIEYNHFSKAVRLLSTYFTSDDGGSTWTQRFSNLVADRTAPGASANVLRFTDAWVDPEGDDVLVIGGMNRLQTSPDWGDIMTDGSGNLTSLVGANWMVRKVVYTGDVL